ncbi:hypothetical protein ACEPAF_4980 [Sanghuangporus sanghuang]
MPALYTIPHPYNMQQQQQQRQRRAHRVAESECTTQEPGSSLSYPIVIPPSPSHCAEPSSTSTSHLSYGEVFAWPSMWFDVPSISTSASPQSQFQLAPPLEPLIDMYDTLPDLIHSDAKTPDASPVSSLRDACTTPAQENTTQVAICDVPLLAPRPLPFTPPAFLQFDCLPDEDEDLSFPPYTYSRRHLGHSIHQKQNPRKRPAPPPNTPAITSPGADAEMDSVHPASIILSKKRRRLTHGENAAPALSLVHPHPSTVAPAQPGLAAGSAVFFNNPGQFYFHPQLAHYTGMMSMGWV